MIVVRVCSIIGVDLSITLLHNFSNLKVHIRLCKKKIKKKKT